MSKRTVASRSPKPMPMFDEMRSEIEMDLSVLREVYRDKAKRPTVLAMLRRARAALLIGDLGVNGQIWAIHNACEDAASEIYAGADPTSAMRGQIDALSYHQLRIPKRGGRGPLLVDALLADRHAIEALARAAKHLAFPNPYNPYEGLARELIHEAAVRVGLQKRTRKSKAKPRSGDESPEAKSVREAISRARRLNAERR